MTTITQTVEETLTFTAKPRKQMKILLQEPANDSKEKQKLGPQFCPPGCVDCQRMTSQLCPPGCEECKKEKGQPTPCPPNCLTCQKQSSKTIPLIFNVIGIIIAILATYMIISTDSHLYLVFWVGYSVLRRMMMKCKPKAKTE